MIPDHLLKPATEMSDAELGSVIGKQTDEDIRRTQWDRAMGWTNQNNKASAERARAYFDMAAEGARRIAGLPSLPVTEQIPLAMDAAASSGPATKWLLAQTEALKRIREERFICQCGGTIGAKGYQCAFCGEGCK